MYMCACVCVQLKHCGKLVLDTLLSLIKSLEISPAKHLLHLVSQLDPSQHTEQVTTTKLLISFGTETNESRTLLNPCKCLRGL